MILIFSIIAIKDTAGILNPFMLMLYVPFAPQLAVFGVEYIHIRATQVADYRVFLECMLPRVSRFKFRRRSIPFFPWKGSRLVLNLREAMNRTYVNTSTFASQTMTTPVFAPNPMLGRTQGTMTVTIT